MRFRLLVLVSFGCGSPTSTPSPTPTLQPRAGIYTVRALAYANACYPPDTLLVIAPPFEENTLRLRLLNADSTRGVLDAVDGRIVVRSQINGVPSPEPTTAAYAPDYGQYLVRTDTLWLDMQRTIWLNSIPLSIYRDGTLAGSVRTACEQLAVQLAQ